MTIRALLDPRGTFRRAGADERGIAATEFGLIAPVFFMVILALFDLAHMSYARAVFEGAVERAAREASLERGSTAEADEMVYNIIGPVLPGVTLDPRRESYFDFADIDRPEQFTDTNGNDMCDNGEAYVDENRSGSWESDVGVNGNGGSSDVVMYTVTATYTPVFKVPFMPDAWNERTLTARAVRKNQPFGNQLSMSTQSGTCTG